MIINKCNLNPYIYHFSRLIPGDKDFDKWWDKELFNWSYSGYLARYCGAYFERWWDSGKYNWQSVNTLIRYCSDYFHIWWDPKRFNWNPRSTWLLMRYHKDKFHIWWNPERFPWKTNTIYLIKYFSEKFLIWWDEERFPWNTRWRNLVIETMLIKHCQDYFITWYFSKHFRLTDEICRFLNQYCQDFKDLWAKDYVLYKLAK